MEKLILPLNCGHCVHCDDLKWDTGERLKDNQNKVWPQEDHRQVSKQKIKVQIHKWLHERQ